MALLNYTTKIEAARTVGQIQVILAQHGAKAILMEYDNAGLITALSFRIDTPHSNLGFRLPVHPEAVLRILEKQKGAHYFANKPQAVRVAWRIVKDWLEAQLALLETEMVKMEEIFLPYLIIPGGQTLYDRMVETQFQLTQGDDTPGNATSNKVGKIERSEQRRC